MEQERVIASFRVGAAVRAAQGGGHLDVRSGRLVLRTGPLTRRFSGVDLVMHDSPIVHINLARLLPWMAVNLVVEGSERTAIATFPLWRRRAVREALRSAGFDVHEHRRWIGMGLNCVKPQP